MRRTWAGIVAAAALAVACSGQAPDAPDEYPTREITVLVPYTAGGPTDLAARTMGAHLEKALGQPVIVENLPGAAGSVAMNELVSSEPDGHTLTLVAAPSTVVTPMIQDVPYDAGSFVAIGVITEVPSVLAVAGDSEFADAAAFFDAARQRPGELNVGTPGATTSQAIELRRLANEYGVQATVVPFNGNAELIQAVLGGTVDAVLINVSADIRAQFDAGAFRPLAISPAERVDYLPDVPTLAELGFPELTYSTSLFGLGAPAGTPPEIVSRLEAAMRDGLADPAVRQKLDEAYVPDEFIGADAFRQRLDKIVRVYGPVAQELKGG
ncbi:tripartite-type tricarboxylate transporter receptor subunit TctC [Pseudonocardia hierapolitana]|uniref:Tripartite-type tricarboxylate transporter receptor subunit TctC n=1 Tax=Pseudonocardia hierapolitana TaxID=1128676 RepID=A0A561SQN6_9PSEU|nr:tripartite tricarboxylate transporter substrate binding protein [Pseudonocardia hierapolitana]TWF77168.1 tripartite-type tricarboxylate transporter receptor subunit TctC [Pseudonocardia hierapolitana]